MIFSSLIFLFRFLPAFFLVYFAAPQRLKNLVLFLGSLIFYAWGEPVYVGLMLFSAVSDYAHGIFIEKSLAEKKQNRAKAFLFSSLCINLLMLGFFKYADFLISALNGALETVLLFVKLPLRKPAFSSMNLPLPVGISFYTFQTMSYTIDVYRKKVSAQKNFIAFCAFVTMFPQLIAGPIVQYKFVERELQSRHVTQEDIAGGLRRFLLGLGKKVLLANQAGEIYERIGGWNADKMTALAAWVGILSFAFQIYFDFSGYSDMAVGLGKLMGFDFPENFNYPYVARSVTDFWRRWHMSLSGWFREYVYIPLGGNRRGIGRQIFNILVVWALTGIWHGASWNFLLWGLWFGIFLVMEKMWLLSALKKLPRAFGLVYTWLTVLGGWTLFFCDSPEKLLLWGSALLGIGEAGLFDSAILYELSSDAVLFALLAVGATPLPARVGKRLMRGIGKRAGAGWQGAILETAWLLVAFGLSVAFLVNASYNPFLYFRF